MLDYDDCLLWLSEMVVLLVYNDWLLWMFIIITFDGCFSWLFILINVFYCLIVYWLLIITYLSWFLALSVMLMFGTLICLVPTKLICYTHWIQEEYMQNFDTFNTLLFCSLIICDWLCYKFWVYLNLCGGPYPSLFVFGYINHKLLAGITWLT